MNGRADYFERSNGWADDHRKQEQASRRIAWVVAGAATAAAMFEAVALALLVPLKTVQPITLLVDRQTGYVQALDPLQPRRIAADAALTQSYLAQYVTDRERFDRATVGGDYRRVALMSAGTARSQYLALMPATNPDSPFQRYPGGATVVTRVKSVSPLSRDIALVRFDTIRQDRAGSAAPAQPWISVVRFRYADAAMTLEDRLVNPLGFQVTSYRRDAELPSPSPARGSDPAAAVDRRDVGPGAPHRVAASFATAFRTPWPSESEDRTQMAALRDVPSNQVPMGSPLEPPPRAIGMSTPGDQP